MMVRRSIGFAESICPISALFDDGVVTAGQTGSGKEILNIAQPANLSVQEVLLA